MRQANSKPCENILRTHAMTETSGEKLTIAMAQITQSVGDLCSNADAMLLWREQARGADLIVYPELQLIGYPPEVLVLKPALIEREIGRASCRERGGKNV